jgi:hypothetical protein
MTTREVLDALARRWYVVAVGLLGSALLILAFGGAHRFYTMQTEYVLVGPGSPAIAGLPDGRAETLINFAGVVQQRYIATHPTVTLSSPSATLFGNGVREGVSVQLSDGGSQWQHSFNRPVLIVQVIGSDPDQVEHALDGVTKDLEQITRQIQVDAGAAPNTYITVFNDAQHTEIGSFGSSHTGAVKGSGLIVLIGLGASAAAALVLDRKLLRRNASHAASDTSHRQFLGGSPLLPPQHGRLPGGFDAVTFLTIYLVLVCAIPSYLVIPALGQIGRPSILWGLVGIVWWIYFRLQRSVPTATGSRPVRLTFSIFLGIALGGLALAYLAGLPVTESGPADSGLIHLMSWAGVALVAYDGISTPERILTLLRRIALAGGLMALLGLTQFITGRSWVDSLTLPGFAVSSDFDNLQGRAGFLRVGGTASHPLEYASVLCIALPIGIVLGATDRQRNVLRRWLSPLAIGIAISLSVSRSAIVGTAAGLILLLPAVPSRLRLKAVAASVVLVTGVFLFVPGMLGTLKGLFLGASDDPSTQSRNSSLPLALTIAGRHPWIGSGFGTFLPQNLIMDDQYLGLVIQTGYIGLAAFIVMAVTAARAAWSSKHIYPVEPWDTIGPSVACGIVAVSTTLIFFDGLSFSMTGALLFVLIGTAGAIPRIVRQAAGTTVATVVRQAVSGPKDVPTPSAPTRLGEPAYGTAAK